MSRPKIRIAIYQNLPSGGANELYISNKKYLLKKTKILEVTDSTIKSNGFVNYLYKCLFILPRIHREINSKLIRNNVRILISYHTWLTKSPYLLRYSKIPKIYICHEPMREYYDQKHISMQNIKEKLINLLKISIMYIDKRNVKSEGLTIISNSEFSKKSIDKAYKVDSLVIYPGINVKEFIRNTSIKKRNQILSVGAINKLKGYEFIIEVVSKIEKELRPDLVIVGNGGGREYLAKIKKLAKTLHVNLKVKINITRPLLIEEYLASKLFIYAPINEPFGIVVEEAMAAGLPVVGAKNGGGYSEILSNDNGALIDSSDSQLWAKKLSTILRDNAILRKIGQYNFKYVQKYYTDKIMNDNLWKVISSI